MPKDYGVISIRQMPVSYTVKDGHLTVHYLLDSVTAFYYGKITIYKLPAVADFATGNGIEGTAPYFVREQEDTYGYFFRSMRDTGRPQKFNADSFLQASSVNNVNLDEPTDTVSYQFSEVTSSDGKDIVHKFALRKRTDESEPDTLFFHFTKNYPDIPYSFSAKLDSLRGMKLWKIRLFYREGFFKRENANLPDREMRFTLRYLTDGIPSQIIQLAQKVKELKEHS